MASYYTYVPNIKPIKHVSGFSYFQLLKKILIASLPYLNKSIERAELSSNTSTILI